MVAPEPKLGREQVFRTSMMDEPASIDPSLVEDIAPGAIVGNLFANLVRYRKDLTIEPDLAESWTISPDAKTYTFRLRDWKWSDGRPGSAKDFEYSIKRLLDPKVASPYASFVYEVKGAETYNTALGTKAKPKSPGEAELARLREAVGVKALDDRKLQIELEVPATYFLSLLPQANLAPLRQDVVEKHGDKWTDPDKLVSNGPFLLESWTPKSRITLRRNPGYWDTLPTLDRVEVTFQSEDAAVFAAYLNDELDTTSVPDASVPKVREDPKLSKEVAHGLDLATYYVGFNIRQKPFDDRRVRQAFQMAVDTKTLCEQVLGGIPLPARSFIPPGMPGHQPELGLNFDPANARSLIAEAGYPDGKGFPKVTLVYNTSAGHKLRMEYVQAQLKANLGLEIALENWETKTYWQKVASDQPAMFRVGWTADYPHPNDFLRVVWEKGSGQNYGQWSHERFDELNRKAMAEPDERRALDLYAQAQAILVDEAPAIWLYWYGRFTLYKPWVEGVDRYRVASMGPPRWREFRILAH